MRRFDRLPPPQYLTENWEKWGNRYAKNKKKNSSHTFQWATYKKRKVNQLLLPLLTLQTQSHCSYCDYSPPRIGDDTIDHFKAKGNPLFYHLAFHWGNLYFCCNACQRSKMEQFDDLLLRPDDSDYSFGRYFILDTKDFDIKPNQAASTDDQKRAAKTIEIFKFNDDGQTESRRRSWLLFWNLTETERSLEDFAFRFMFDL